VVAPHRTDGTGSCMVTHRRPRYPDPRCMSSARIRTATKYLRSCRVVQRERSTQRVEAPAHPSRKLLLRCDTRGVNRMGLPALKSDRIYTYGDYRGWKADERWELINARICRTVAKRTGSQPGARRPAIRPVDPPSRAGCIVLREHSRRSDCPTMRGRIGPECPTLRKLSRS
jgi:hypothetical protein